MTIESGTPVQLDGRQLNLSPHNIAALGLQVSGPGRWQLATQAAYVGRRFLDRLNTAAAGGYVTGGARFGWGPRQYTPRSGEHTPELPSQSKLACRLLLLKKKK